MNEGLAAILATVGLTVAILIAVYREPDHNALDEPVYPAPNARTMKESRRLVNIFKQAHQGLNLSPEERAFLKLVKGFLLTAAVAALGTLATVITNGATLHDTVLAVVVTFAITLLLAVAKYFSANGQPALTGVAYAAAGAIEKQYPEIPAPGGIPYVAPDASATTDSPPDGAQNGAQNDAAA